MRYTVLAAAIATAALGAGIADSAKAGEGMWVPQQLPEIAGPLKTAGLKLDPKQLANLTGDPMGAVAVGHPAEEPRARARQEYAPGGVSMRRRQRAGVSRIARG